MGIEDQNIALVRLNTCLMGEKNNRFHVLVHTLWAKKIHKIHFQNFWCKRTKNQKTLLLSITIIIIIINIIIFLLLQLLLRNCLLMLLEQLLEPKI